MTNKPSLAIHPQKWDVWHARFNYDGNKGYKYRPVLVVSVSNSGTLVMMITSATNKLSLEHDYHLQNWQNAGLEKPSIARCDRIAEIPADYLGSAGKIGHLSERDIKAITLILNEMLQ